MGRDDYEWRLFRAGASAKGLANVWPMGVVEVQDLHRTYRTYTGTFHRRAKDIEAVRGVSFEIEKGELFGLLGPNGAGKTTTIKMLITLLIPTSGTARVLGFDVVKNARDVRKRVGYVFGGERGIYERLSGYDNLRYFAELYGVPARAIRSGESGSCSSSSVSRAASTSARRGTPGG
jgi:ABC-type multidrug transport system ATPase subunit